MIKFYFNPILSQLSKNTPKTSGSVSSVIIWARLYRHFNLDAPDSDSGRYLLNKSYRDWIMLLTRKSKLDIISIASVFIFFYCVCFRVKITEDGKKALLTLANGDMRKVLNVLQSTWLAYKNVTEDNVYNCVGHPLKTDIENILKWLLNDDVKSTYISILFFNYLFTINSTTSLLN